MLTRYKTVPGAWYGTPKEVWGFRYHGGGGPASATARRFLKTHASLLGLDDLLPRLESVRTVESLGAVHVLFQQRHRRVPIHRAYVTVHVARDGHVYLVKNRAVPTAFLPPPAAGFDVPPQAAVRRAVKAVTGSARVVADARPVRRWYPGKGRLRPTYRVRVRAFEPRRDWIVYVDAASGALVHKYDILSKARGVARVFDPHPVAAVADWRVLLSASGKALPPPETAYRQVPLSGLASTGRLDGRRVTTRLTTGRVRVPGRRFCFDAGHVGFAEAMAYCHVDGALRYLESLGYRGRLAILRAPVPVDVRGTQDDQSWYSPSDKSLSFGTGGIDDAEDGEIILHELGHAIQDAICPDFGQSDQAAAMGEGFGDYFAASYFAGAKAPRLRPTVMAWDAIANGGAGDPPCGRRLDEPLTFESYDHGPEADEHDNGPIWSAALWDIWNAVGRDVADRIIVESHFQLDGFTTFARGARAILDADRNLFGAKHVARLRAVFRARGIGPVE